MPTARTRVDWGSSRTVSGGCGTRFRRYLVHVETFDKGLETQRIGGMPVKIYSAARSVVDCFKFRNKLGLDVALEARRDPHG